MKFIDVKKFFKEKEEKGKERKGKKNKKIKKNKNKKINLKRSEDYGKKFNFHKILINQSE